MKFRSIIMSSTTMAVLGFAGQAMSHHSFAMFDQNKPEVHSGVVSKFQWRNPHVFIVLDVTDDEGKVTRYKLECSSISMMSRAGWKHNTITVGDKVEVQFYPLRNGKLGGMGSKITLADGTVLTGG